MIIIWMQITPLFQPGRTQQDDVEFKHTITQHLGKKAEVYKHFNSFIKNGVKVAVGQFVALTDTNQKEEDLQKMTVEDFRYFLIINMYVGDTQAWVVDHEYMTGIVLDSVYNINTSRSMQDVNRSSETLAKSSFSQDQVFSSDRY